MRLHPLLLPLVLLSIFAGTHTSCVFDRAREDANRDDIDPSTDFGDAGEETANPEMSDWMKMAKESQAQDPANMSSPSNAGDLGGLSFTFDPSAALPAPGEVSGADDSGGSVWDISGTRAIRTAKGERRLLLVWFTASKTSPRCTVLDAEVFQSEQFAGIAEKDLVLLYIDYSNRDTRDSDYYTGWKVRNKVRGYPTIIVFSPGGKEVGRIKGYTKGDRAWFIHQLKKLIVTGNKQIESENAALAKKGYRSWSSTMGNTFFARYESREGDDILLRDLKSKTYRTSISNLSPDDLIWLSKNGKLNSGNVPPEPPTRKAPAQPLLQRRSR